MPKTIIAAFTGPSNSGKTTLICRLIDMLAPTKKVAVIKHDPKDKAVFDTPGKDSDLFYRSGAETIIVSPKRTTYFSHESKNIDRIYRLVGDVDYLFIEGLKTLPYPRIGVFREKIDERYLDYVDAVAIDNTIQKDAIPSHIDKLNLDNIGDIIEWIEKNGKEAH